MRSRLVATRTCIAHQPSQLAKPGTKNPATGLCLCLIRAVNLSPSCVPTPIQVDKFDNCKVDMLWFWGWQTLGWICSGCWCPLWSRTVVDRLGEEWCFFGSRGWVLLDGQGRCVDGNQGKYPRGQVSRCVLRVRFLLVHTEDWHFSVNKRVLCTIGGQRSVVSQSTEGLLIIVQRRGVVFLGQHNSVVYE